MLPSTLTLGGVAALLAASVALSLPTIRLGDDPRALPTDAPRTFRCLDEAIAAAEEAGAPPSMQLTIEEGSYEIPAWAVVRIPVDLLIEPGVTIALGAKASIVAERLIEAGGSAEKPILFTWSDPGTAWGVLVLTAIGSDGSSFRHCTFEHASPRNIGGTNYIATLLAEEVEDVVISDCTFRDIEGDGDAVNIVDAYSIITRSVFANCADAIDYDSSRQGIIEYCEFFDNRDDAIDLGEGADAICRYNRVFRSGDKGISVGERSLSLIHNNLIVGCDMGVAIKDQSNPWLVNNTLVGNNVGVAAYRKTPFLYGGGKGIVVNTIIWGSVTASIDLDEESTTRFRWCDVQGGWDGDGNIDADPVFTTYADFDYFLSSGSPSIDSGSPQAEDAVYDTHPLWPEGHEDGPEADMGAYGGPENQGWAP